MTSAVWKFQLGEEVEPVVTVKMPPGAKVLCVQVQHDTPQLWAKVSTDAIEEDFEERRFRIAGTGHQLDLPTFEAGEYVGTFQLFGGSFIGHVFEEASPF